MKKYMVELTVEGRYVVEVEANDFDDAVNKAKYEFGDADLNDLEIVGTGVEHLETEDGKYLYSASDEK